MNNENQFSTDGVGPLVTEKLSSAKVSVPAAASDKTGEKNKAARSGCGSSPTAVQDLFLNGVRRENIDVVIYLTDGTQERGVVRAFDTFTLLVENRNSGKSQLVYKHAVARIFPVRMPAELKQK